jgi:hypothetical protein
MDGEPFYAKILVLGHQKANKERFILAFMRNKDERYPDVEADFQDMLGADDGLEAPVNHVCALEPKSAIPVDLDIVCALFFSSSVVVFFPRANNNSQTDILID